MAFGDSITDGARSTPDMNSRWPDYLARRLAARRGPASRACSTPASAATACSATAPVSARWRASIVTCCMQTGVTHVIVMEGINDIGLARTNPTPSAADLIAGHKQLIERARARGLKVYGATLTPFEGAAYWTAEGEAKRQALNEWIRTSKAYDAVIDFDQVDARSGGADEVPAGVRFRRSPAPGRCRLQGDGRGGGFKAVLKPWTRSDRGLCGLRLH